MSELQQQIASLITSVNGAEAPYKVTAIQTRITIERLAESGNPRIKKTHASLKNWRRTARALALPGHVRDVSQPTRRQHHILFDFIEGQCQPHEMRVHLDECSDTYDLWTALLYAGFDVTSTADEGLQGVSDARQLAFARRQRRILITLDRNIIRDGGGQSHCGIVVCHRGTPPEELAAELQTCRSLWN